MSFMSDIHSRLIETANYVNILKSQFDQVTKAKLTLKTHQGANIEGNLTANWTINCSRLIAATKEIQKHLLDNCLMTHGRANIELTQLDTLQELCEILGKIWLDLWTQIRDIYPYSKIVDHLKLREDVEKVLRQLIERTFIVIFQPPQVLKTHSRFPASVRFLTGQLFTPNQFAYARVSASILNESQVRTVLASTSPISSPLFSSSKNLSAEVLLNKDSVVLRTPTVPHQFVANFPSLMLKKITRTEKKGQLSVADEKFAISFQSEIKCADGQLNFFVQTFSLPLVVIVHCCQEVSARATILWDNSFAAPSRLPFDVPDEIPWANAIQMLNDMFTASVGCNLNAKDAHFLAVKVFRDVSITDYDSKLMSWSLFAKQWLPNTNFSFWDWFNSVVKLTRETLTNFWRPGNRLIYGFISRQDCENELIGKPDGTFLLRFSETELGRLSIAYTVTTRSDRKVILNLSPFNSRDLTIRSLADRISDIEQLEFLFPDIPKDVAFGSFYGSTEEIEPSFKGYVKSVLVTQVPGWTPKSDRFHVYPQTPQANFSPYNEPSPSPSSNHFYQYPPSSIETSASCDTHSSFQSPNEMTIDDELDQLIQDIGLNLDGFQVDSNNVDLNDIFANINNFNQL